MSVFPRRWRNVDVKADVKLISDCCCCCAWKTVECWVIDDVVDEGLNNSSWSVDWELLGERQLWRDRWWWSCCCCRMGVIKVEAKLEDVEDDISDNCIIISIDDDDDVVVSLRSADSTTIRLKGRTSWCRTGLDFGVLVSISAATVLDFLFYCTSGWYKCL